MKRKNTGKALCFSWIFAQAFSSGRCPEHINRNKNLRIRVKMKQREKVKRQRQAERERGGGGGGGVETT